MTRHPAWHGALSRRARAHVARRLPAPCSRCGEPVALGDPWDVDHVVPSSVAPELVADPRNWQPAHRACNRAHGQALTTRAGQLGTPSRSWT